MEVILIEPVRNLGKVGDVVKVRNGYGRNYLIPTNKALRSTDENRKYYDAQKSEIDKKNQGKTEEAARIAAAINGTFATLVRQAGEDGRLYGSVSSLDIARELSASGETVDRKQVVLLSPIKYIGVYSIQIHLHGDINAQINVNVARTESEAKDAEVRVKRGEKVMEGPEGEEAKKAEELLAAKAHGEAEKKKSKAKAEEGTEAKAEAAAPAAEAKKEEAAPSGEEKAKKPKAKKAKKD